MVLLLAPCFVSANYSTTTVRQLVIDKSIEYGVDVNLALYVAEHESSFKHNALGDMNVYKKGKPIRARGLWQITEFYHPNISDEQSFDPIWSTEWAMQYLKDPVVCKKMWSTCRAYYLEDTIQKITLDRNYINRIWL